MYHTYFFDIGNVLLFFNHSQGFRNVAKLAGVSEDVIHQMVDVENLGMRYESGMITTQELCDIVQAHTKTELDDATVIRTFCDIFTPNEEVFPVIRKLKEQSARLVLLSNIGEAYHHHIFEEFDIFDLFDEAIMSYAVGAMKPDGKIYEAALEIAGCKPEECFFTDDIEENVLAAREYGINAFQFVGVGELELDISRR